MEPFGVEVALALVVGGASLGGGLWWWRRSRPSRPRRPGEDLGGGKEQRPPRSQGIQGALAKTAARLRERLDRALASERGAGDIYEALEEALVGADVGVQTTAAVVERVRKRCGPGPDATTLRHVVRDEVRGALGHGGPVSPSARPWVVVLTGVNGVGKTTTIGKLAQRHRKMGQRVLLVAADTFRAAAGDQLGVWAERVGAEIIRHAHGADPSSVAHDGMRAALARGVDLVLIDTAGRLHTRAPLMEELRKIHRTIAREMAGAPHETLLVVDATTGQNAVSQARTFGEAVALTGVVLTKLDGTAKGGTALALAQERRLPIRYVGVGEGAEDLRPFDAEEFADGLLGPA